MDEYILLGSGIGVYVGTKLFRAYFAPYIVNMFSKPIKPIETIEEIVQIETEIKPTEHYIRSPLPTELKQEEPYAMSK